jgi:hypothetical protein
MPLDAQGVLALAGDLGRISCLEAGNLIECWPRRPILGPSLSERLCLPTNKRVLKKTHCCSDTINCKRMDEALDNLTNIVT